MGSTSGAGDAIATDLLRGMKNRLAVGKNARRDYGPRKPAATLRRGVPEQCLSAFKASVPFSVALHLRGIIRAATF